ncbi:MAG: hypothetical protein IKV16_03865, partial [Clostridia bacterium]|nr:hypothetical protein [Clostridia bacterium]
VIEGYENLAFDIEKFAQFSVACGKPLSLDVLKNPVLLSDGTIDLSEYGLSSESRVKTEIDEEGNEIELNTLCAEEETPVYSTRAFNLKADDDEDDDFEQYVETDEVADNFIIEDIDGDDDDDDMFGDVYEDDFSDDYADED